MNHNQSSAAPTTATKLAVQEIDVHTVKNWLDNAELFTLIDVREDHEWTQGHLPKAIHIKKSVVEQDIVNQVANKNTTLVLYCAGGYRSALAADSLQKLGYTQVFSMAGGIHAWCAAGFAMVNIT